MKKIVAGVLSLLAALHLTAQHNAAVISTHTEREVIPEGIAINPANGTLYVSSIALNKIIVINKDGSHRDLFKTGEHGFLQGLGLKADNKTQLLWAVSNETQPTQFVSKVHAFDLNTGEVKHQFTLTDTAQHLFNDLIIHSNGSIYITDTYGAAIYEVDPARKNLKLFIRDSLITYPNGIAQHPSGKLYIATYSNGPMQLDVKTKQLKQLTGYSDSANAYNLDGLVFWNNSIIAVHNGEKQQSDNAIKQYHLNAAGDKIVQETNIDKGNTFFNSPTTATVQNNRLYVLSNSYLGVYNDNKESVKGISEKLGPVTILVYNLKK